MSFRRRAPANAGTGTSQSSRVRGPNSALTAFLRDHGINDDFIRRRQNQNGENDEEEEEENENENENLETVTEENDEDEDEEGEIVELENKDEISDEELQIRIASRRKKRLAKDNESDYTDSEAEEDAALEDSETLDINNVVKPKILTSGAETNCFDCENLFQITIFTRKKKDDDGNIIGYFCKDCTAKILESEKSQRLKSLQARKKRMKLAEALLDKQDFENVERLQDICIKVIIKYVDQIDQFGNIGNVNLEKICRILCKKRLLTDKALPLFLESDLKDLELPDCALLNGDSLKKIAAYSPKLESLKLRFAARLNNSVFDYFIDKLDNLHSIELDGSFLIFDDSWEKFFKKNGSKLKKFHLRNSYRFTDISVENLVKYCPNLDSLTLSKLEGIIDVNSYEHIIKLKNLKHLEISFPIEEHLVPDSTVIKILEILGSQLEELNVDGCTALTNDFLPSLLLCTNLKTLSLKYVDQITDDVFASIFEGWGNRNLGLTTIDFQKCVQLGDLSIKAMLIHSANSLVSININGMDNITREAFELITEKSLKFPTLTSLDCGFVRCVDNKILKIWSDAAPLLTIVEVFGCNKCNGNVPLHSGMRVIGRQSDTI